MERWIALIVGVDEYLHLPILQGATNDAKSIFQILSDAPLGIFDKIQCRLLLDPSKHEFESELASFFSNTKASDKTLFYFAGHAAVIRSRLYFCTNETSCIDDQNINPATATPFLMIDDLLNLSPSRSVITIIDACHSAALSDDDNNSEAFRSALNKAGESLYQSLGAGYQYLSACRQHQSAHETTLNGNRHGQLTAAIINAIRAGAGTSRTSEFISFTDVCNYVDKTFINLNNQQPVHFNRGLNSPIFIARNINYKSQTWDLDFSKTYVDILARLGEAGDGIHKVSQLLEGDSKHTNWRKLLHWDLIESPRIGFGCITIKGGQFLRGEIEIAKSLKIKENKVIDASKEVVSIRDFYRYFNEHAVEEMLRREGYFHAELNPNGSGIKHQYKVLDHQREKLVVDHATGLIWQQLGNHDLTQTWDEIFEYIGFLNKHYFAGYNDWRLPTLDEAMSLMESKKNEQGLYIDSIFDWQGCIYTADTDLQGGCWLANFIDGSTSWDFDQYDPGLIYVQVVRRVNKDDPI